MQLEKVPTQWNESKVIILFKKGDMKDIKNYRPISLLPHMYKVFTRIILARVEKQLDENQPREQAGFRAGFRTSDHLQTLSQVIKRKKEYRFNICLGFVDYEKAFEQSRPPVSIKCNKAGLNMNIKKIKMMMCNKLKDYPITVQGKPI